MTVDSEHAWARFTEIASSVDDGAIVSFTIAHPCVMNATVLNRAFEGPPGHAAQVVATLRNRFDRNPASFPLGEGEIERLAEGVLRGELTLPTAIERARRAEVAVELGIPYVRALVGGASVMANRGAWNNALPLIETLGAAVEKLADEGEALEMKWMASLGALSIVTRAVSDVADGALFERVVGGAERLLEGPEIHEGYTADALYRLGVLHLDPWIANRGAYNHAAELRAWRSRTPDTGVFVPEAIDASRAGEAYLRRAAHLRGGTERGKTLKALVQLLNFRERILGEPIDGAELVALAREGLDLLQELPDTEPATFLSSIIASHTDAQPPAIDWQNASLPSMRRAELAIIAMQNHARRSPAAVLQIAREARSLFDGIEDDSIRITRWTVVLGALRDLAGTPDADDLARLAGRALASVATDREAEILAELDPAVARDFDDVFDYLRLSLCFNAGANAAAAERWGESIRYLDDVLDIAIAASLPKQASLAVERIVDAVRRDVEPMSSLSGLMPIASKVHRLEALLGDDAQRAAHELGLLTLDRLAGGSVPEDAMLMAHQLVKGARLGSSAAVGARLDVRESPRTCELLDQIRRASATTLPVPSDGVVSDEWLLASYARARDLQHGDDQALRAANLRQTFDGLVRADFSATALVGGHSAKAMKERLPERTALLSLAVGMRAEGGASLFALGITRRSSWSCVTTTGFPGSLLKLEDKQGRAAVQHPLATHFVAAREAIREPPGPGMALTEEAVEALTRVNRLFKGILEWIGDCERQGDNHLIVAPHGFLHYFPFHLLGPTDAPLATRWTVSQLPSLLLLSRLPPEPRPSGVTALGLDYREAEMNPFGLQMLVAANKEAKECAQALGVDAYLDAQATRARFFEGLRNSRYVHFSGHGVLDVVAPSFQTLFLAPEPGNDGRLFAHELLIDSFAGCELVSLSACESGLGRFDLADNLMGVPASLLTGGVRYVVATLWSVDVAPARVFFRTLYGELAADAACLDAFSNAQRATRKQYPAFRDWGAFVITGV